jgi:hypothetical protein
MKSQDQDFVRLRIILTATVSALILGLLLWTHFHGGVPSHHILQRKDLPEISNWWGGILLPVLTWFLLIRIKTRIQEKHSFSEQYKSAIPIVIRLFCIGLVFGIILAVSFANDYTPFLENVLYILLILSLIVPIYYSEFILGFILGMTYTFGALLPTAFILIMASVGFLLFRFIRPLLLKVFKSVK